MLIPAIFDMINALPDGLRSTAFIQEILTYAQRYLPMFDIGFSWVSFSLIGLIVGLGIHFLRRQNSAIVEE